MKVPVVVSRRIPRFLVMLVTVLAIGFGLYEAIDQWWTCDDAYIHFRYSENLAEGRGLIYNEGEYVEGYLTVLWNLILAGAIWAGFELLWFGNAFGLPCFVATIGLLIAAACKTHTKDGAVFCIGALPIVTASAWQQRSWSQAVELEALSR